MSLQQQLTAAVNRQMTLETTLEVIGQIGSEDTAQSDLWVPERPLTGHCALASVLIKIGFGGTIARAEMNNGVIHYWNVLPTGAWVDATKSQFEYWVVPLPSTIDVDCPEHLYWFKETEEKYVKFRMRFEHAWTKLAR